MKEQFEVDYMSFRTEVSKRRKPLATRELSKILHLLSLEGEKNIEKLFPNERSFALSSFSENSVFRVEQRGLAGGGHAERRNLPFQGDLHQT